MDEVTQKAIQRMVRSAVEFCYGETTPPPHPYPSQDAWPRHRSADGQEGEKTVQWNLTEPYTHEDNIRESGRVLNLIRTN